MSFKFIKYDSLGWEVILVEYRPEGGYTIIEHLGGYVKRD
jgi:hypothetical protein